MNILLFYKKNLFLLLPKKEVITIYVKKLYKIKDALKDFEQYVMYLIKTA